MPLPPPTRLDFSPSPRSPHDDGDEPRSENDQGDGEDDHADQDGDVRTSQIFQHPSTVTTRPTPARPGADSTRPAIIGPHFGRLAPRPGGA